MWAFKLALIGLASFTYVTQGKPSGEGSSSADSDPSFDHQTKTYTSTIKPAVATGADFDVLPFFSPDSSAETVVDFVNAAEKTLDIMSPGLASWSGCTSYSSSCVGCSVANMSAEAFPVFQAILNAVHRGVSVRLITNNYETPTCPGLIAPLDFLQLAGVSVRYYTSTTFCHAKFMVRDGKATSISSVNWTWNSYMNDREAGMILSGTSSTPIIEMVSSVYEKDWSIGTPYTVNNTYSTGDLSIIHNPSKRTVTIPNPPSRPYVSPKPSTKTDSTTLEVYASPDFASSALLSHLYTAKKSLQVYIYQVSTIDTVSGCFLFKKTHAQISG